MKNLDRLLLIFAILFALFFIAPAFLKGEFPPYPLLNMGDILDLFTPLVLMPIYYLIFRAIRNKSNPLGPSIAFVVLSAVWVEGQGMHLGANAIGHHLSDLILTDAYKLTYFLDELLSHKLWHIGIVGMVFFLLYVQWKNPSSASWRPGGMVILAAILHGLTLFPIFVEGQNCTLGALMCLLVLVFVTGWGRRRLKSDPIILFFYISCGICLILMTIWYIYWGGSCPEFSAVLGF